MARYGDWDVFLSEAIFMTYFKIVLYIQSCGNKIHVLTHNDGNIQLVLLYFLVTMKSD